jgi:hypothetical protein
LAPGKKPSKRRPARRPPARRPREEGPPADSEALDQLKFDALTAADESRRTQAVRQIALAPVEVGEKGSLLLHILADSRGTVRRESAEALKRLGFRPALADALVDLVGDDAVARRQAVERLRRVLKTGRGPETDALAGVLTKALGERACDAEWPDIVGLLQDMIPFLKSDPAFVRETVAATVRCVGQRPDEVGLAAREMLSALVGHATAPAVAALREETDGAPQGRMRAYLLGVLADAPCGRAGEKGLTEAMVEELVKGTTEDVEHWKLGTATVLRGAAALKLLLDRFETAPDRRKPFLVRLIDQGCTLGAAPKALKKRVAEQFLDLLRTGRAKVRFEVLKTDLCYDTDLPKTLRANMAEEFIAGLHQFRLPETQDRIIWALERMGPPALAPIVQAVRRGMYREEKERVPEALGTLVRRLGDDGENREAERAVTVLHELAEKGDVDRRSAIRAVGVACSGGAVGHATLRRLADTLTAQLWQIPETFEAIGALGHIAAAPNADLGLRTEVVHALSELLRRELPSTIHRERKDDDGTIRYEFGKEVDVYTVMLPMVITGLERICLAARNSLLQARVVSVLLERWESITSWKIIWGPLAIDAMIRALAAIGSRPEIPEGLKLQILRSVARNLVRDASLHAVASICRGNAASPAIGHIAGTVASGLLRHYVSTEPGDPDERSAYLDTLGALGAMEALGGSPEAGADLKAQVVRVLYDGLRDGIPRCYAALRGMAEAAGTPAGLVKDIGKKLKRFSAVAPRA